MDWNFQLNKLTPETITSVRNVAVRVKEARSTHDLRNIKNSPEGIESGFSHERCISESMQRVENLPLGHSVVAWVLFAQPTGDFLRAVLMSNLVDAYGRADEQNTAAIPKYVSWLYNDCPSQAWGEGCMEWGGFCELWGDNILTWVDSVEADWAEGSEGG